MIILNNLDLLLNKHEKIAVKFVLHMDDAKQFIEAVNSIKILINK
jgi:hypothetical protein